MMRRYETAMKSNMASAEKDYRNSPEHQKGFVVGAIKQFWELYHDKKTIDEQQFDHLIEILAAFMAGKYGDFINSVVKQYKDGNPPIIIGY